MLGSINIDLMITAKDFPQEGETILGSKFRVAMGGKGANQAASLSKLGNKTFMLAAVGNDEFGERAIHDLEENYQVDTSFVEKSTESNTGVAMIVQANNNNKIIVDAAANMDISFENVKMALGNADEGDIILSQFEIDPKLIDKSFALAKEKNLITAFNPAPAKEISSEMYKNIDYLILNQSECEFLSGIYPETETDCRTAARKFINEGCQAVIITLGKSGSTYIDREQSLYAPAEKIKVIDTTGAGDSFIGAFLSGLNREMPIMESLRFANFYAGQNCTVRGARDGLLSYENAWNKFNPYK